jgi:c-di-GMP phosphodiesterase
MAEVFIGRQPIYDRDMRIEAYELLFRAGDDDQASFVDGDAATSEVIQGTFMDLGLERIVGDKTAFINLTRAFLTNGTAFIFPQARVVLELLEDIEIDEEIIAAVRALTERGYRIALDDYVYQESHAPILHLAKIVKIDLTRLSTMELKDHVRQLRGYKVKLLAEKVETREEYLACLALGFDYFQGYYLSRPMVLQGQRVPTNRMAVVQLVNKLYRPDVDLRELETHIASDVSLSYHLLRFINSAFYGLGRPIESIQRAVVYLGRDAIRNWITIITLRSLEDQHSEALGTALVRARMTQRLAEAAGLRHTDSFFTVGMFSILEQILQLPMEQVLEELPMSSDVNAALLRHEGPMGEALACALAFEGSSADEKRRFGDLDEIRTGELYLTSVAWANDLLAAMGEDSKDDGGRRQAERDPPRSSSFILHPSSFILHPSSFILQPSASRSPPRPPRRANRGRSMWWRQAR